MPANHLRGRGAEWTGGFAGKRLHASLRLATPRTANCSPGSPLANGMIEQEADEVIYAVKLVEIAVMKDDCGRCARQRDDFGEAFPRHVVGVQVARRPIRRPTPVGARFPAPVTAKTSTMPAQNRLRLNDRHGLENRRYSWMKKQAIAVRELNTTAIAPQHGQMMPQRGILCFKPALRLEERDTQVSDSVTRSIRTRFPVHTEAPWRESKTAEPSVNILSLEDRFED